MHTYGVVDGVRYEYEYGDEHQGGVLAQKEKYVHERADQKGGEKGWTEREKSVNNPRDENGEKALMLIQVIKSTRRTLRSWASH